jgi:ankyrin repeat protein
MTTAIPRLRQIEVERKGKSIMKSGITSSVVRIRVLAASALIIVSLQQSHAATNDLASTLQKGLFEEEANHNYSAAITAYESVVSRFDDNRKLAATAIFRIGEIYRKQGKTNEATAQYQRVLNEFADQSSLAALSRETLRNLGPANTTTAPNSIVASTTAVPTASAESAELAQIQNLIRNSPDLINAPDRNGQTLLQTAAAQGKLATVAMLLENGASVEANKSGDLTPLHFAAGNGHKAVVDLLLSKGAKAGASTSQGVTPLHLAVRRGYEAVAKTLLDAGASPNAALNRDANRGGEDLTFSFPRGYTPLHVAATSGYPGLIPLLVSKGADINALDDKGRSAMSFAVETHLEPVVQALLAAHADPNAGSNCLPLHLAAYEGNTSMIELLLSHGADPNKKAAVPFSLPARPTDGVLPLSLAVYQNKVEAAKALLKAKADPNDPSLQYQPLIFNALPQPELLKALVDAGANPNVRPGANTDEYASSPLESAVKDGRTEQVEMLLAHGADPKTAPRSGYSALHAAASIGSKPIAELLIKAGAPLNAQDRVGSTPLHKAVANRRLDVAQSLLDHKADPNVRDGNGRTPFELAKELVRSDSSQPRPLPGPIGQPPPSAGQSQPAPAQPELMVNLLRQYGAVDDLPRLDRIEVRRPSANFAGVISVKSTNDWNQFTLVELVAMHYRLLSDRTFGNWYQNRQHPENLFQGALAFPDFEHLVIDHPAQGGKSWAPASVNLLDLLNSGDCSHSQKLQWGDVVEIPEADHPVADQWPGLSEEAAQNLVKCVSRNITVVAKGAKTQLNLAPGYEKTIVNVDNKYYYNLIQASFMLRSVLDQYKLIRFSSDLTRVKVTRPASTAGKAQEWIFDCSDSNKSPAFWLRDGDTIEIPDKT